MVCILISILTALGLSLYTYTHSQTAVDDFKSGVRTFADKTSDKEGDHNLPFFPPPFIGRDENMSSITEWLLHDPSVRGVHITGAPAIGKSRLAVEVGHRLARMGVNIHYGTCSKILSMWLSVEFSKPVPRAHRSKNDARENDQSKSTAMTKSTSTDIFSWWSTEEENDIISNIISWARGVTTPTILMLDNCDDVLEIDEMHEAFLNFYKKITRVSKHVKVLSTSRVKFTLVGIKLLQLKALDRNSSIELLQEDCETFKLNQNEPKRVADLVGCNPLGLRIAAGLACNIITVKELIKDLSDNSIQTLSSETISDDEKMQSIMELSVKYLEEKHLLCARNITFFLQHFNREMGRVILSGCGIEDAIGCMNKLSRISLLEWFTEDGESQYKYPKLVYDFLRPDHIEGQVEPMFCKHYVNYMMPHIKRFLKECGIEMTEHCKKWYQREEMNILYVVDLSYCLTSLEKRIEFLTVWSDIIVDPTLWKMYDTKKISCLMEMELRTIVDLYEELNYNLSTVPLRQQLTDTFEKVSKYMIEWGGTIFIIEEFSTSVNLYTEQKMINLCIKACQMYCSPQPKLVKRMYLHLCLLGCNKDCRYSITGTGLVVLLPSLLFPLLLHCCGVNRYSCLAPSTRCTLAYIASVVAATALVPYLMKLVQICISYIPLSGSQYVLTTVAELTLLCGVISVAVSGQKSRFTLAFCLSVMMLLFLVDRDRLACPYFFESASHVHSNCSYVYTIKSYDLDMFS